MRFHVAFQFKLLVANGALELWRFVAFELLMAINGADVLVILTAKHAFIPFRTVLFYDFFIVN